MINLVRFVSVGPATTSIFCEPRQKVIFWPVTTPSGDSASGCPVSIALPTSTLSCSPPTALTRKDLLAQLLTVNFDDATRIEASQMHRRCVVD